MITPSNSFTCAPVRRVIFFLLFIPSVVFSQTKKSVWVDSVLHALTVNQKIGQLFMIPVSSRASKEVIETVESKIKDYDIGGVLITGGGAISHVKMINRLQGISKTPLLVGTNAEWGLQQVLDSTISFQRPLLQGAVSHDTLLYRLGAEIGNEMKVLGIHLNFAPNADIDINDETYPTTLQYFGSDKRKVAQKSIAFMNGLQNAGAIAVAKHLPNSRRPLQAVSKRDTSLLVDLNHIDTTGLYPFQQLIKNGVKGILTSNIDFNAPGKRRAVPAAASQLFVSEILKKKLDFQGIAFAEVPYLQTISNKKRKGESEELGFLIGNDMLIDPQNLGKAVKKIAKSVRKDAGLQLQLDQSVRRILAAKYDAGLFQTRYVSTDNLLLKTHSPEALLLKHQLAEAAVTVLRNEHSMLPVKTIDNNHFISLCIGKEADNEFNHYLSRYAAFEELTVRLAGDTLGLLNKIDKKGIVIVSLFPYSSSLLNSALPVIRKLSLRQEVIVCSFGDPEDLKSLDVVPSVIASYTEDDYMPEVTAQVIFGGLPANGQLPQTLSPVWMHGQQISTPAFDRFSYTLPEAAGMDSRILKDIERIAREAIDLGATPGCQILVAKDRKIIYERSFGWLTYDQKSPVQNETIYDLASVTKVSATLQAVMFMQEKGLIDINKKVSEYLPELKNSNKKDVIIKDILTHQAGLWPYLPFWAQTVKDSTLLPEYYSQTPSEEYPFPVADGIFASRAMKDSLWQWIIKAKVRDKVSRTPFDYRYSDMGFYIMQHVAEKILNQPMEDFLEQNIYEPLGAYTTGYLPRRRFPASRIAPTENDKLFRRELLTGYVHDQGAAMHGGIAGHAGLFSTANDLAKLGQMWLQKGSYGGLQYFKPETLDLFTAKQFETSRRGLGWDKPTVSEWNGPTSLYASAKTFGHTGFTGTCIWVDPELNLLYIFLSNRVNPDMNNNKILNANIRPRIQDVIYRSIFEYCASGVKK